MQLRSSLNTFSGATGAQGPNGRTGSTGATGLIGPLGPKGLDGIPGRAGVSGATGATGASGGSGATGWTGAMGPSGLPGIPGAQGWTGIAGELDKLWLLYYARVHGYNLKKIRYSLFFFSFRLYVISAVCPSYLFIIVEIIMLGNQSNGLAAYRRCFCVENVDIWHLTGLWLEFLKLHSAGKMCCSFTTLYCTDELLHIPSVFQVH
jgi:Collagen triple helix repeat (20 copies)